MSKLVLFFHSIKEGESEMEAWLIVLITISSGIALFAAIFALKNRSEKRKAQIYENRATTVQVIQSQPPSNGPPPYNPGFIHQPQGQAVFVHPPIPSTSNQGLVNPRNPQDYYHPSMSNVVQVNQGRFAPTMGVSAGVLSNPTF